MSHVNFDKSSNPSLETSLFRVNRVTATRPQTKIERATKITTYKKIEQNQKR